MVQEYKSPVRVYKYPFELVMAAYVRRFPTCDMIPVLISTDVLKQETSSDGSLEVIERRCKLNVDAPYLLKKMAGVDFFYCIQRNTLDRRNRTLEIEAWNETFSKKIIINELCTYSVHPENPGWTCFEQSASLEVRSFFGFENAVEKLAVKHYAQSIEKGKEIIEHYVRVLQEEGVTSVDVWQDDGDGASGYTTNTNETNPNHEEETSSSRCQSNCESRIFFSGTCDSSDSAIAGDMQQDQRGGHMIQMQSARQRRPSLTLSHSNPDDDELISRRRRSSSLSQTHRTSRTSSSHSAISQNNSHSHLHDHDHEPATTPVLAQLVTQNNSSNNGNSHPSTVKSQHVMSKAKDKICFIYNHVISDGI